MTVVPIGTQVPHTHPAHTHAPAIRLRRPGTFARGRGRDGAATITLTVDITVGEGTGEELLFDVLSGLRDAAARLTGGQFTAGPVTAAAGGTVPGIAAGAGITSGPAPAGDTGTTGPAEASAPDPELDTSGVVINPQLRYVLAGGVPVSLSNMEFNLLAFLAERRERVWTRAELLDRVWSRAASTGERTVDVHVRRLRSKLGASIVLTVPRVGYRITDDAGVVVMAARRRP